MEYHREDLSNDIATVVRSVHFADFHLAYKYLQYARMYVILLVDEGHANPPNDRTKTTKIIPTDPFEHSATA